MKHDRALLIIDMQEALALQHDQEVDEITKKINTLLNQYPNDHIVYIRHLEEGSEFDKEAETSKLYHKLKRVNDHIIEKYHHSAFFQTSLQKQLEEKNIKNIDIVGYQIEYCVDATIKMGFYLGYNVTVHSDMIGTFNSGNLSKNDIKTHYLNIFRQYANII